MVYLDSVSCQFARRFTSIATREWVFHFALASSLFVGVPNQANANLVAGDEAPTNIVVILLDDVGTDFLPMYSELNPYAADLPYVHGMPGSGDAPANGEGTSNLFIHCPSLMSLAQEGVTFENAYAMPYCSPTRASLMTGNYPGRTGIGNVIRHDHSGGALEEFGDPGFESQTLAELVQGAGYQTSLFGKWHLGATREDMDPSHGSDERLGWQSIPQRGHFDYFHAVFNGVNTPPFPPSAGGPGTYYDWYWNRNYVTQTELEDDPLSENFDYATSVQLEEAAAWCNSVSEPFLCYVSTNAVHSPWGLLPPDELVQTDEYENPPVNAFSGFCATFEALDALIGEFLDDLDPLVRAETLFIVMGDNGTPRHPLMHARIGGPVSGTVGSGKDLGQTYDFLIDAPQERFKGSVYEKGTRVPLIIAGKGVVNGGRTSSALVDVVDIFPTIADFIGEVPANSVQGISILPLLQDSIADQSHARDFSFCEIFSPNGATGAGMPFNERKVGCSVRIPGEGRYKLVVNLLEGTEELYQLEDPAGLPVDPFETVPLDHEYGHPNRPLYNVVHDRLMSLAPGASAQLVNLSLAPELSTVQVGEVVELQLIVSANGPLQLDYSAVDALVDYDPNDLVLLGVSDALSPESWFASSFLPDPDGINTDLTDGEALYSALCTPGTPAQATSAGSVITTLRFLALQETAQTTVSIVEAVGAWGETQVYAYNIPGHTLSGNITASAAIQIANELEPTGFCFGEAVDCPCNNAGGAGEGCRNSTGQGALLGATGSTSVTLDDLVLVATQVPAQQYGVFVVGGGTNNVVFGDGLRCVSPGPTGLHRFNPPDHSGASATITRGPGIVAYSADFPAGGLIEAGGTYYFQTWFRDPFAGPCGSGWNLTNGLEVSFVP